jgi:predicted transcriptional regulator
MNQKYQIVQENLSSNNVIIYISQYFTNNYMDLYISILTLITKSKFIAGESIWFKLGFLTS